VEQHRGHFQIGVGQLATRVGLGDNLAGTGLRKLDSPDDGAEVDVTAEPYSAGTRRTCIAISCVVIVARDEFFDMCWAGCQIVHHVSQVKERGPDIARFSEFDDAWFSFEGFVDGGK
jgi:hypothetical protein